MYNNSMITASYNHLLSQKATFSQSFTIYINNNKSE